MYRVNFILSVRIYVCSWPQFFGIDVIESDWWYECWYGYAWVTGLIADVSPSHQKQKLWLHVSDYQFWIHLGPGIGGFMAEVSHRMPFYFAGALGILAFIMSVVLIHDPKNLRQVVSKT